MAVTSLWHVKGSIKDVIGYIENPEKTVPNREMQDFFDAFSYVKNPLNAFVDKIVVHEREKKDGKRTQQIDIYYSYIGIVDIPTDEEMREMEQEYMQRTKRQTA